MYGAEAFTGSFNYGFTVRKFTSTLMRNKIHRMVSEEKNEKKGILQLF